MLQHKRKSACLTAEVDNAARTCIVYETSTPANIAYAAGFVRCAMATGYGNGSDVLQLQGNNRVVEEVHSGESMQDARVGTWKTGFVYASASADHA